MPLMPKRVKHRKMHRGSRSGNPTSGTYVAFGDFGLQVLSALVRSLREELFNLRLQQATGQLENNQRIRTVRKDLARALTIKGETGEV